MISRPNAWDRTYFPCPSLPRVGWRTKRTTGHATHDRSGYRELAKGTTETLLRPGTWFEGWPRTNSWRSPARPRTSSWSRRSGRCRSPRYFDYLRLLWCPWVCWSGCFWSRHGDLRPRFRQQRNLECVVKLAAVFLLSMIQRSFGGGP